VLSFSVYGISPPHWREARLGTVSRTTSQPSLMQDRRMPAVAHSITRVSSLIID